LGLFINTEPGLVQSRSVKKAADQFLAMNLPLHVLINNAGILVPKGDRGTKTVDGFEVNSTIFMVVASISRAGCDRSGI
jgi:hypothetical protein